MSESVEVQIDRLTQLGAGAGAHEGRTIFVDGALPGERVRVRLVDEGKTLRGELLEVLSPSPERRELSCPLGATCGGCDWLHLREESQGRAKEEVVLSALEHLGGLSRSRLKHTYVASPRSFGYRRRAVLHFHPASGQLGLYRRGSHEVVEVASCAALVPELSALLPGLSAGLGPVAKEIEEVTLLSVPRVDEKGEERQQISLAVRLKVEAKPRHRERLQGIQRGLGIRGAVLLPSKGAPEEIGRPVLRGPAPGAPGLSLFYRADAFAQANVAVNDALVGAVLELAELGDGERVLELYAGNGNLTLALSTRAGALTAVESAKTSVDLATRALREAKREGVRYILGDALEVTKGLAKEQSAFDTVVLDPPRTGAPGIAPLVRALGAKKVVYVACDPAALARDGRALEAAGYAAKRLVVLDMFPQTRHVESVMSFSR